MTTGELTVEYAVRDGLEHYPTLFRTRADVLWHILVGGGGYEWVDGGPVEVFDCEDRDPYWASRSYTAEARQKWEHRGPFHHTDRVVDFSLEMATDDRDDIATVLDGVDERAQWMRLTPIGCPRQPAYDSAFLHRDDARPDWAQAITEMRTLYAETMAAQAAAEAKKAAARDQRFRAAVRRAAADLDDGADTATVRDVLLRVLQEG